MKCPACDSFLVHDEASEFGFWRCPKCGGLWMPFGVLEELISHEEGLWEEAEEVRKVKEETVGEGKRICPEDGAVLRAIPYREDAKVRVDECPTCSGIWLDAGELRKIGDDTEGIFANLRDEVKDDATALEVFLGKILPFLPK